MNPLRIHIFQHVPFEGPANLNEWFKKNNCPTGYTRFYGDDFQLPALNSFDRLIIMGGPMGVNDEKDYPWLKAEKAFIRSAIAADKTVVGICLGSQLIASALGQKVYPNKQAEIGWFPILKTEAGKHTDLLHDFPDETTVFHWHGDTFDIPPQASHLLFSEACPNQSFVIGNKILALQFHLEVNTESLEDMLDVFSDQLTPAQFVQSAAAIRTGFINIESNRQLLFRFMDLLD